MYGMNPVYRLFTRPLAHSARPMWSLHALLVTWCAVVSATQTSAAPPATTPAAPQPPATSAPPTPPIPPATDTASPQLPSLTMEKTTQLALQQASAYQQAVLDERIAALELTQSRAALLPKVRSATSVTYNKPLHAGSADPAFIAQNASREYQELLGVEGSLDFGLRAAIMRNRALLEAAHAGTEVARRELIRGAREAYFGLALASAKRRSAEEALAAAGEPQRVTPLPP